MKLFNWYWLCKRLRRGGKKGDREREKTLLMMVRNRSRVTMSLCVRLRNWKHRKKKLNKCLMNVISVSLIYCQLQFCYGITRTNNVSVSAFVKIYWLFLKLYVYWALNNKCTPCTFFPVLRKYRAINKTPFMGSICCMFVSKTNFILETGLFMCMYLCISVTFMRQRHHQKKALAFIEINLQVYPM